MPDIHIKKLVNQIFEIIYKRNQNEDLAPIDRNLERIIDHLRELGWQIHNPLGEKFTDTRTDLEANIIGDLQEDNMVITKVIKPILYKTDENGTQIVQKAVVIVEPKK